MSNRTPANLLTGYLRVQRLSLSIRRQSSVLKSRRFFGTTPQCRQEDQKLSFRGQLYESTAQRLKREREDEERFAQRRERIDESGSRTFAITLCQLI